MPRKTKKRFAGVEKIDAEPETIAARIMQKVDIPVMRDGEQVITKKGSKKKVRKLLKQQEQEEQEKKKEEEKRTVTPHGHSPL